MLITNSFDTVILHGINHFAQRSATFDRTMAFLSDDVFIRGGLITGLLWWAWFRNGKNQQRNREILLVGLVLSVFSMGLARALALSLPYRVRPFSVPELNFRWPIDAPYRDLIHWSSFPSDHAVLYFALATCVFLVSRKAGVLAYLHAFFLVCLPRVYLGEHYPTDILAGAALGVAIASLSLNEQLRTSISGPPMRLFKREPAVFYACIYLVLFLCATNFAAPRKLALGVLHAAQGHHHEAAIDRTARN